MHISNILKKIIIKAKTNRSIKTDRDECIIFGSGPSLDRLDRASSFLEGKDLIGCNFLHNHASLAGKTFKLYSMIDNDYTKQIDDSYFQDLRCDHFLIATKNAYAFKLRHLAQRKVNVIKTEEFDDHTAIDHHPIVSGTELVTGNSLPFLIQCAAFLAGYKVIYLFGADHYSTDDLESSNNFNDYQGRKIKDLSITREKLDYINRLYSFMKDICEGEGIKIFNVTPDSKLEMFEKIDVPHLLKK